MKKLLLAVLAVVGGLIVARRLKAGQDERDLWHEATTAPDLR
ncbi:MAG: DLW-39 family protein [Actinomycetota bacterium]|nr:DLW-39 family protein [Actinomycetota bacterium]